MSETVRLAHDWYPAVVPPNVAIGERTWLYSAFAFRHFRSRRPDAVRIGRDSGIYVDSFFNLGPDGAVTIGDYSTLVSVIIDTNGHVRIGSYCFLAHEVVIADTFAALPPRAADRNAVAAADAHRPERSAVSLGDDVWVGAGAVLLRGAQLGDGAIVGAGTIVDFAVPARAIVAGNPARIVGTARAA